jgi:hypothetical protein
MVQRRERLMGPRVYLGSIAALVTLTIFGLEIYCRWSPRFNAYQQTYVKQVVLANARNAVFGDSHVGQTSYLEGFDFLGEAGQKPEELLRLVRFLYTFTQPDHVILEMDPQWISQYHISSPEVMLNEGALPPGTLPVRLLISSRYFRESIRANLVNDAISSIGAAISSKATAAEIPSSVDVEEVNRLTEEWRALMNTRANPNWAMMEHSKRRRLTLHRVFAQNPVADFSQTRGAQELEKAIDFLIARGAKLCLVRTPVTSDYIELGQRIPDSRYDAFSAYARGVAAGRALPFVSFSDLNYVFDDSKFINQDHLTGLAAAEVWPLVKSTCFGR